MKTKKIFISGAVIAALFTGCGGGGSSSSSHSNSTVSGTVADGYLVGATVFFR